MGAYLASERRYQDMNYHRCGNSGVMLPPISLGLWHNFGSVDCMQIARAILRTAFDRGITHFDLANNYGPPYGSAEENFGVIFKKDFIPYRDELFIATKAGYDMWPGPYGNFGSRKYLTASLDQSLLRMGLSYVDLFYHHRPDPETPLQETMLALADIVRQGKALYVGISNYSPQQTQQASELLRQLNVPFIIHQAKYNIFERKVETGLLSVLAQNGLGCIAFSPLAQGLLTNRYLQGVPEQSRAARDNTFLDRQAVAASLEKIKQLAQLAQQRSQSLAQMAIAWLLRQPAVTSVLVGASSAEQLLENCKALEVRNFSDDELQKIDLICGLK